MTDTTRDLIQRLTDALDHLNCEYNVPDQSALVEEALDYLDQPEPEGLTDELSFARAVLSADRILAQAAARKLRGDTTTETP